MSHPLVLAKTSGRNSEHSLSEEFPLGHAKSPEVLYLTPGFKHHCIYQSFATCPRIRTTIVLIVAHTSPINSCGWKVILSTPTWPIHLDPTYSWDIQRYPDESLDWLAAGGKMQETMGFTKYIGISCNLSCKPNIRCFVWQIPPHIPPQNTHISIDK